MFLSCCLILQLMFLCSVKSYITDHWLLKKKKRKVFLWLFKTFLYHSLVFICIAVSLNSPTERINRSFSSQMRMVFRICQIQNMIWKQKNITVTLEKNPWIFGHLLGAHGLKQRSLSEEDWSASSIFQGISSSSRKGENSYIKIMKVLLG